MKTYLLLLFAAPVLLLSCELKSKQEKLPDRIVNYDHHINLDERSLLDSAFNVPPYTLQVIRDSPFVSVYWVPRKDERIIFMVGDSLIRTFEGNYDLMAPGPVYDAAGNLPLVDADTIRLNNDVYADIIMNAAPNMHGQRFPNVFLGDSTGHFTFRPDIRLPNIGIDSATGLIKSFYIGGVYSYHYKELYKWENNRPMLVNGAGMQANSATGILHITFYRPRKSGIDTTVFRRLYTRKTDAYDEALFQY